MTILSISTLYLNVSATITWCIRKSTSKWTSVWQRTRGGKIQKKWKSQNLLSLRTEIADFIMKQFFSDIIEYLGECSVLARELCAAIAVASQLYNFKSIIELKHCTHNEWITIALIHLWPEFVCLCLHRHGDLMEFHFCKEADYAPDSKPKRIPGQSTSLSMKLNFQTEIDRWMKEHAWNPICKHR